MSLQQAAPAVVRFSQLSEERFWRNFLSEDEVAAADAMKNPAVRARFQVGRGMRRRMLGEAAGLPCDALTFVESAQGKPRASNAGGWEFNVSHSGDYVAVVMGRGPVGVDLEQMRPLREMPSIVERYFHADESAEWKSLAPGLREEAFFVLWSAREASMKCVGLGLARGLSVTRVDPAILSENSASARVDSRDLEVRRTAAPPGYVAIVAELATQ